MRRPIEDGLSLLAGAGIGVALMYLMDPDQGAQRRRKLAAHTGAVASGAAETAGNVWDRISDASSNAAARMGDVVRDHNIPSMVGSATPGFFNRTAQRARDAASSMADHFSSASDSAQDQAGSWYSALKQKFSDTAEHVRGHASDFSDNIDDARHRANIALGREREHHYVGQSVCALGSLALGAGIVYLLDPRLGRARRAHLRDKSRRWLNEAGDFFRVSGRYVTDHLTEASPKLAVMSATCAGRTR